MDAKAGDGEEAESREDGGSNFAHWSRNVGGRRMARPVGSES